MNKHLPVKFFKSSLNHEFYCVASASVSASIAEGYKVRIIDCMYDMDGVSVMSLIGLRTTVSEALS